MRIQNQDSELTVGYWFACGFDTLKKNLRLMMLSGLIFAFFYILCGLVYHLSFSKYLQFSIKIIILPVLYVGQYYMCLRLVRGCPAKLSDMFKGFRHFLKVWVTTTIVSIIFTIGFLLAVIPGVFWGLKYHMSLFAVMDKGLAPHKAMSFSSRITEGYKRRLFWLLPPVPLIFAISYPFAFGLQSIGTEKAFLYMAIGIVPYLASYLILTPWLAASWAAAYDALTKHAGD